MMFRKHTQYGLVLARDSEEAIERAIVEQPNLVLMDVIMSRLAENSGKLVNELVPSIQKTAEHKAMHAAAGVGSKPNGKVESDEMSFSRF